MRIAIALAAALLLPLAATAQEPIQVNEDTGAALYTDLDYCRILRVPDPDLAHCAAIVGQLSDTTTVMVLPESWLTGVKLMLSGYPGS